MTQPWSIDPPDAWLGPLQELVGDRWRGVARPSWPNACDCACQELIREISGRKDAEQTKWTPRALDAGRYAWIDIATGRRHYR